MIAGSNSSCTFVILPIDYSVPQDSFPPTVSECLSLHYGWIVTHTDNSSPAYDTPHLRQLHQIRLMYQTHRTDNRHIKLLHYQPRRHGAERS